MEEPEKYLSPVPNFVLMNLTNDTYLRIVKAKMYIDENYQEAIDLDSVSKKAFISKFHFHRLFRHIYKKTPHEYITRKEWIRLSICYRKTNPFHRFVMKWDLKALPLSVFYLKKKLVLHRSITAIWLG
jgi:AraC-like DNA-binding protein